MKAVLLSIGVFLGAVSGQAAPLFPQCPAIGLNTGCAILITVNPDGSTTVAADPTPPNNGPYDGEDDTLIGVLNNSTSSLSVLPLASTLPIFGFDLDGVCAVPPQPVGCVNGKVNPADTTGYAGPGVFFAGISADKKSGLVLFSPGIQPGGSAWFALEERLSPSQIDGGPITITVAPEPGFGLLVGAGLAIAAVVRRRVRAAFSRREKVTSLAAAPRL